jgi:phosphoglycolate phosphatase
MHEIIFDLDGTLWNPSEVIIRSWNKVLGNYKEIKNPITIEQLSSVLGLQIQQIGEKLFPYLDDEKLRTKIMDECCSLECEIIEKEGGVLFKDMEKTIKHLHETHPLFIISNCQSGYIEAFLKYYNFEKYFIDIECAGNTGLSKGENIKLIIDRYNLKDPVYVGDTQSDCDASNLAGIPFIFAGYGFGKAKTYDYYLNELSELSSFSAF